MALVDNFRLNVIAAIKAAGLSQQEVAARAGIHFVTLSRILRGHISPNVETCEKIAIAVGIRPETIFREPVEKLG